MANFEITYRTHITVEAESFEDAKTKFMELNPIPAEPMTFTDTETMESKEVIGFCEISEKPIFEDDDFKEDPNGVMWLKSEEMNKNQGYPAKCPLTNRPFFMLLETEDGTEVPTYGGPFDSYTIPQICEGDEEESFIIQRYDHDFGGWAEDEAVYASDYPAEKVLELKNWLQSIS